MYRSRNSATVVNNVALPALGPRDVLIRITHSGVCYVDALHAGRGDSCALGHEGVGVVGEVGTNVTTLAQGDRAGGGFYRHSCGKCRYCLSKREFCCPDRVIIVSGDTDNGTFAKYFVGKETYVNKIPDEMVSEHAAPLQCAGPTFYNTLKRIFTSDHRVGVIGIGDWDIHPFSLLHVKLTMEVYSERQRQHASR